MRSLLALGLMACPAALAAQQTGAPARSRAPARYDIAYLFDAKDPSSHLADVRLRVRGLLGDTTRLQLPAWYPGRYAIYNFAANVQEAHAACDGRSVPSPKRDKQTWAVHCPASGGHAATGGTWSAMPPFSSYMKKTAVSFHEGDTKRARKMPSTH